VHDEASTGINRIAGTTSSTVYGTILQHLPPMAAGERQAALASHVVVDCAADESQ
jgi:hypothetical protein